MIDKIVEVLVGAGPLGLLSATLLAINFGLCLVIKNVFNILMESQKSRIEQGEELARATEKHIAIIQGLKEFLQNTTITTRR